MVIHNLDDGHGSYFRTAIPSPEHCTEPRPGGRQRIRPSQNLRGIQRKAGCWGNPGDFMVFWTYHDRQR